ncbi:protein phosphatase 2C domain-containing protein [Gordonia sp. NPDC003424]
MVVTQIVDGSGHRVCRILLGSGFDPAAADAQAPIAGTRDSLQVQVDGSMKNSYKFKAFSVTFIATLVTGLVCVALLFMDQQNSIVRQRRSARVFTRSEASILEGPRNDRAPMPVQQTPSVRPDDRSARGNRPAYPGVRPDLSPKTARSVELASLTTSGVSGLTIDRGSCGQFDVYAATQVGLQHAHEGGTREDAYAVGGLPDGSWVLLAVADGLGGARDSHAAAQLAVRATLQILHTRLESAAPPEIAEQWNLIAANLVDTVAGLLKPEAVHQLAVGLGYVSPHPTDSGKSFDPATTLVFAALGPVTDGAYTVLWGSIGDSDALTVDVGSGQIDWLTSNPTKQTGGLVSNVTHSLPRSTRQLVTGAVRIAANKMVVLATDGMADAIRQEPRQFGALLPRVAGPSPAEWAFGELVGFELPGLHDDRTLAAAWPRIAANNRGRTP